MESKMKNLAATTGDSFRKIFDGVSLENPEVGARINFLRMEAAMRKRREKRLHRRLARGLLASKSGGECRIDYLAACVAAQAMLPHRKYMEYHGQKKFIEYLKIFLNI